MGLIYAEQLEDMDYDPMQETHESEIKLLNEIDKLAIGYEMGRGTKEALEEKLDQYIEHVKKHFADEEALMEKYNFPSYEMHKTAHDMFLMDLQYAVNMWKNNGNINKMITFIRKVPEWLQMHVNSVDAPTASFIARKESGS